MVVYLQQKNSETYTDTENENETGQCQWVLQRTTRWKDKYLLLHLHTFLGLSHASFTAILQTIQSIPLLYCDCAQIHIHIHIHIHIYIYIYIYIT